MRKLISLNYHDALSRVKYSTSFAYKFKRTLNHKMSLNLQSEARFKHEILEDFEDGEVIFEEGDTGRDLYIVQSGSVRITKKTSDTPIEMAVFKKGDFFGDMALLQSLPRYASATAIGKTRLLILKPAGFLMKIRRDPTFAFEMIQQLSYRVKMSNDRLLQTVEKHKIPLRDVQALLNILGGNSNENPNLPPLEPKPSS